MKNNVIVCAMLIGCGILVGLIISHAFIPIPQVTVVPVPVPVLIEVDSSASQSQIEETIVTTDVVPSVTLSEDDFNLLCACVEAEAGNQSMEGKRLVAAVILNRVDDSAFPNTISGVIRQKGQFYVVSSGAINRVKVSDETMEAVGAELLERSDYEVLYFRTGRYHSGCKNLYQVGDHFFSGKK